MVLAEARPSKARMTSEARIEKNRINAQLSTGPRTAAGKARSSKNACKHGLYSERDKVVREESLRYELRLRKWTAAEDAQNDLEEFFVNEQVSLSFDLEQTRAARIEARRVRIERADADALARVRELGSRLYFDPTGPAALYGHQPHNRKLRTSSTGQAVEPNDPAALVDEIAQTALGCRWLLQEWDSLRDNLEPGKFWSGGDRLKAIKLLGRQPVQVVEDRRVADILAASHALRRAGKAFDCLNSDMNGTTHESFVKEIRTKWTDLVGPEEKDKAREILIDLVDTEIEQIEMILQDREGVTPEEQGRRDVAALNFDKSPDGELMRRYELRYLSALRRGVDVLKKIRGKGKERRDGLPADERRVPIPEAVGRKDGGRRTEDGGRMPEDVDLSWAYEGVVETVGDAATDGHGETPPMHGGWKEPEIDASDVLACGGLVPARCREEAAVGAEVEALTNLEGDASEQTKAAGGDSVTDAEGLADGADGVGDGLTGEGAGGGCDDGLTTAAEGAEGRNVRNEAKFDENVNITQT